MRNPLSIEAFADWCEKKPADEKYDYVDANNCAMTQYVRAIGFDAEYVAVCEPGSPLSPYIALANKVRGPAVPVEWERAAIQDPTTFGALAKRLREAA